MESTQGKGHMQDESVGNGMTSQGAACHEGDERPRKISVSVLLLWLFMLISQIAAGVYAGFEVEPSGGFVTLQYVVLFWLVGDWLMKDNRQHHIDWVFDMGFFLYLAWPLIIPFYLFKTRGVKALLIIAGFIAGYLGAWFLGMVCSFLFLA
jgi:hypothetical protein